MSPSLLTRVACRSMGLVFLNAEAMPWLDIFAYTGYKFVRCVQ
jgi:hypothetical protein